MQETKPLFIIKKYRSILRAAIIVEAVNFIVSLTDGIIAGNFVGAIAFAAIGLLTPFVSVSTFLGSIVNTGTVLNFSYQVGKFNKRRANEYFSQGVNTALITGGGYALALFLLGFVMIRLLSLSEEISQYLNDYYYIILFFFLLQPVSFLLDNILIADGDEQLSAAANITLIVSNVVFSLIFVRFWNVRGIAVATVLSRCLFILIACFHFFRKKNTIKYVPHWSKEDLTGIVRSGIVKATTYGLEAVLNFIINLFVIFYFDDEILVVLVVVERFLGLLTLFIGLSMSCQPLIGTLRGENNTKGQYYLMKTVLKDMISVSTVLTFVTFIGAPLITVLFGITEDEAYHQSTLALRIVSSTLILQAVLVLFFIYYVTIQKQMLAFIICLIKNFISPVVLAVVLALVLRSHIGVWIGLAIAPVLALIIASIIIIRRYGRKLFPFLITEIEDQKIHIYDFTVNPENAVKMSETAETILMQSPIPSRSRVIASMLTEEVLMLIKEKNKESKKPILAECTFIIQPEGVRIIVRDSGVFFDITDADAMIDSFRQYIISTMMIHQKEKYYLITTGYNRHEFFFSYE